jgi:hypothetical protein
MSGSTRSSPELRERAVRMVIDNRSDYPSEWAALTVISKLCAQLGSEFGREASSAPAVVVLAVRPES